MCHKRYTENLNHFCLRGNVYRWVPESIRWLLANHKTKDAAGIIKLAARVNRVQLSERILNAFDENAQQQTVYIITKFMCVIVLCISLQTSKFFSIYRFLNLYLQSLLRMKAFFKIIHNSFIKMIPL